MTIAQVHRLVGISLVAVLLGACGTSDGPSLDSVEKKATDAAAAVSSLRAEVAGLRAEVDRVEAAKKDTLHRVDSVKKRLAAAIDRLQQANRDAKSSAKAASDSASSALADAQQAIRDLEILTQRFDYHLRHSGG
ncbi:MAG: hypothetical protein M3290_00600 [Actinomycetota bacterium]|nr:hypothetical protein [Actinomycetota bacterium]